MLTIIRNPFRSPEEIARNPKRVKGGWAWAFPPPHPHAGHDFNMKNIAAALALIIGGCPMAGMGALTAFGAGFSPQYPSGDTAGSGPGFNSISLDAAGEYLSYIFQPPKAGDIQGIEFRASSPVGSPTCDLRLESVDAATGLPSGTLFATNTQVTGVSVTAAWIGGTSNFTANASVALTDRVAAKILFASGTSFVANTMPVFDAHFPYHVINQGTPTKGPYGVAMAIRYSDGTYGVSPGMLPFSLTTETSFSSSTNPNHRGNRFVAPVPLGVIGGWTWIGQAPGDFTFILATDAWDGTVDNDGTSNWAASFDKDLIGGNRGLFFVQYTAGRASLTAGATYRQIIKPTSTTEVTVYDGTVESAARLNQLDNWGTAMYLSTANNPTGSGSWTDTTTRRQFVGLWIDQVDNGVGGGGGLLTHPGMSGGIRG